MNSSLLDLDRVRGVTQCAADARRATSLEPPAHLVLAPLYPPRRFGGIEKIVGAIAPQLADLGTRVRVLAFDPGYESRQVMDGVEVIRVRCPILTGRVGDVLGCQDALVNAARRLEPLGGHVAIQAHDWFVTPAAIRLSDELNAPLLAVFHGDKRSEYGGGLDVERHEIHLVQRRLAHAADRVFCYSDFMRECLSRSFGLDAHQIHTFRCGLDPVEPRAGLPAGTDPEGSPTILFLGRLAPEKDVGTLLRALPAVLRQFPRARLRVVGSGSQRAALETLVQGLDLVSSVEFVPFTPDPSAVDQELRRAAVMVLPSLFEPFGLVVLEAIARGVPVVVSAAGGPAEVVRDGETGFTFVPGDPADLARSLVTCLSDPAHARALAEAALTAARGRYDWRKAATTLRDAARPLTLRQAAP